MKPLSACLLSFTLATSFLLAQRTNPPHWNSFRSSMGFSVQYPDDWFLKGNSTDRLMIVSSKGGAEGIIIKRGQALISVTEDMTPANSTLSRVIDYYTQDTDILSRRSLRNDKAGLRGCRELTEVVSREAAVPQEDVPGPVPHIINTEYFCQVNAHKYVTVLRNFESDKKQPAYQEIASRVAQSIQTD